MSITSKKIIEALNKIGDCSYAQGNRRNSELNKLDCLDFARKIRGILEIPKIKVNFEDREADFQRKGFKTFKECEIGDIVFLKSKHRKTNRFFTHVGVKFSETEIIHLNFKNKKPRVESIEQISEDYKIL